MSEYLSESSLASKLAEQGVHHQEGLWVRIKTTQKLIPRGRAVLLASLTLLLSTRVPFPNKISCSVSACVSSDNSFPSVRQEPSFGPWKGSVFLQQMWTLVGFFFTETDILITRGTQGPACLPIDQTQRPQLGPFCPWSPPDADNWPECPDR